MKEYLLIFRGGPQYTADAAAASPEPISPNWKQWMEGLAKKNQLVGGQRLWGDTGAVLKGTKKQLTDGPYAEGKEVIAGYLVIRATDLQHAMESIQGCPIFEHDDASTEIREIAS